jgi:serine protease AprX
MSQITINGINIDPSAPKPEMAALSLGHATARSSDYILVQTSQPLNAARRAQLTKAGARILEAVPGNAVVCWFPKTALGKVRALPFVSWADVYPGVVKISPALRSLDTQPGGVAAMHALSARLPTLDSTKVTVDVVLHRNVNVKQAAKKIAAAAHLHLEDLVLTPDRVRLTLKVRRLEDVAALDGIRHVEKVYPRKLANSVARQILRAPAAAPAGSGDGKGEIIAIADTGFDKGSTTDVHPAFKGRVKKLYALGRPGRKDDPDGHGTHVAGSALGDGVSKSDGPVRGTAPAARLVLQSVLDSTGGLGGLPNDGLDKLFGPPYETDGARIHSNSWGSPGSAGVYDQQAREVDDFVFTHRDILICFAAGNEGKDADSNGQVDPNSVSPPGTAKNCLTVGASENNRPDQALTYGTAFPDDYKADPIKSDRMANNPEGMVAFSSRGPTNDERIKPDVVAPGSYILSTRSRATNSEGWLLSDDPLYMFDGGTSMATPLVAGCVAVTRAFLRTQGAANPSAALMKAMIINGARQIAGQYIPSEAGVAANNSQGFGRVDVQSVVGPYGAQETVQFFDEKKKLDGGDREDRTIPIPAGASRLKVTLVWTDPAGEGLQNDLDLVVVANNQERHGNIPAGSKDFDRKNNVEQVTMDQLTPGNAVISVVAHSIAVTPQNYALVVRVS